MGRRSFVVLPALAFCAALLCNAPALAGTISGLILGRHTGKPLAGLVVAAAPASEAYEDAMAGDASPRLPGVRTAMTNQDGRFSVETDAFTPAVAVDIYGAPQGYATFHGLFPSGIAQLPVIRLISPTIEERHALHQINAFRRAPGGNTIFGTAQPLIFDQNLVETARYWAREEARALRIGHTCAQLGEPAGCVEFNAYFYRLPGAPQDDDAGQNAAFDSNPSWDEANRLFEVEGQLCHFNWRACPSGPDSSQTQTGHYLNLMLAQHWIGLGEAVAAGYGAFFAQNLL